MNRIDLKKLGFTDRFAAEAALYKGLYVGRVFSQAKDLRDSGDVSFLATK